MVMRQKLGYVYIGTGLLWGAVAVDRLLFHVDRSLGWLTVVVTVASFILGAKSLLAARRT